MQGERVVEGPGRGGGVEAPDEDFAIVGGGGEDGAEFGVGLGGEESQMDVGWRGWRRGCVCCSESG